MIVVIGQPRTGTSLAMQMLAAGGINATGEYPAFEDDRAMMDPNPTRWQRFWRSLKPQSPIDTRKPGNECQRKNPDGTWSPAIPEPYYYGLFPWLWRRMAGWRDEYGRKAQLFWE